MTAATRPDDPRGFVQAPVVQALTRIVVLALLGFVTVAGFATLPLVLKLDPAIHETFHIAVPAAWVAISVLIGLHLILRPAPDEPNVWDRAADAEPELTRLARLVSGVMTIGWLVAMGAVIVNHHLGSPHQAAFTFLVTVPASFAVWFLVVMAWSAWCRALLARAEHAADLRLKRYWAELGRGHHPA